MPIKDIQNQQFGKLLVLERDKEKTGGAAYWICKCDCGKIISVRGSYLRSGQKRDCGCEYKNKQKQNIDTTSLIGKNFGRLTVLERDLSTEIGHKKPSKWICQCECGKTISVIHSSLTSGKTKSCGCLRAELLSKSNYKDIKGMKFGMITAIENTNKKNKHGSFIWKCECDCGNTNFTCSAENLLESKILSCGCSKINSKGEFLIEKILIENNIQFAKEQTFFDLKGKNNCFLRYDFAIYNNDNKIVRLIEFDGEQHYNPKSRWYTNEGIIRDQIKNDYAKQHNIPLVRIPYSFLNKLNIEYLLGEQFLV